MSGPQGPAEPGWGPARVGSARVGSTRVGSTRVGSARVGSAGSRPDPHVPSTRAVDGGRWAAAARAAATRTAATARLPTRGRATTSPGSAAGWSRRVARAGCGGWNLVLPIPRGRAEHRRRGRHFTQRRAPDHVPGRRPAAAQLADAVDGPQRGPRHHSKYHHPRHRPGRPGRRRSDHRFGAADDQRAQRR